MSGLSLFRKQLVLVVVWTGLIVFFALWLQTRVVGADAATQPPDRSYGALWAFVAIVWLCPILCGMLLRRWLELPIDQMVQATRAVQAGRYAAKFPQSQTRRDQWGALHRDFRAMQESVASRERVLIGDNERFRTVLTSMNEGVMAIDTDGQIILANDSVCELLMLSPDVVGRKLFDLVRIPELRSAIAATRVTGQVESAEFKTLQTPRKILLARLTALSDDRPTGVAIVFQDVTGLRALETMRRDFVANVSHELKTPLASIKAYAETLRMGAINDQEKNISFVEQIESQANHLHLQIQDLMEIARVESGSVANEVEPVSINETCEICFQQLSDLAEKSGVKLKLQLTNQAPLVMATESGLDTIIENLISNAISHTPSGGHIVLQTSIDEGSAMVRVRDTGIGIDAQHHDRIFERFYRVDKARSREHGGTGLGLAIVKHLVQTFKGEIGLESKVGKGTTFTIRMPLIKAELPT